MANHTSKARQGTHRFPVLAAAEQRGRTGRFAAALVVRPTGQRDAVRAAAEASTAAIRVALVAAGAEHEPRTAGHSLAGGRRVPVTKIVNCEV